MPKFLVFDIGNSNCRAAAIVGGNPEIVPSTSGENSVPSIAYFDDSKNIVGNNAKKYLVKDPSNTIFSHTLLFGDTAPQLPSILENLPFEIKIDSDGSASIQIEEKSVSPEEIIMIFVKHMVENACSRYKESIKKVFLCVPSSMSLYNRIQMKAAIRDGHQFTLHGFVNSTAAAAVGHFPELSGKKKTLFVVDMGSSCVSLAIVSMESGRLQVLTTVGSRSFSGDTIDHKLLKFIKTLLKEHYDLDLDSSLSALGSILDSVRLAKQIVSIVPSTIIHLTNLFPDVTVHENVSRELIQKLCLQDLQAELDKLVIEALNRAKLSEKDIDEVLLTGGSSGLSMIREYFEQIFKGKPIQCDSQRQDKTMLGAALLADQQVQFQDIVGTSIGYLQSDGTVKTLVAAETSFPVEVEQMLEKNHGSSLKFVEVDCFGNVTKTLATVQLEDILGGCEAQVINIKLTLGQSAQLDVNLTNTKSGRIVSVDISNSICHPKPYDVKKNDGLDSSRGEEREEALSFVKTIKEKAEEMKLELILTVEERDRILKQITCIEQSSGQKETSFAVDEGRSSLEKILNDVIMSRIKTGKTFF